MTENLIYLHSDRFEAQPRDMCSPVEDWLELCDSFAELKDGEKEDYGEDSDGIRQGHNHDNQVYVNVSGKQFCSGLVTL